MPEENNISESTIPSGEEVIKKFFENIKLISNVEPSIANALKKLFRLKLKGTFLYF